MVIEKHYDALKKMFFEGGIKALRWMLFAEGWASLKKRSIRNLRTKKSLLKLYFIKSSTVLNWI